MNVCEVKCDLMWNDLYLVYGYNVWNWMSVFVWNVWNCNKFNGWLNEHMMVECGN